MAAAEAVEETLPGVSFIFSILRWDENPIDEWEGDFGLYFHTKDSPEKTSLLSSTEQHLTKTAVIKIL